MSIDYATCELPRTITGMSMFDYLNIPLTSRSYLTAVRHGGGEVQRWLDAGKKLAFDKKAATTGSDFDDILFGVLSGKSFSDMVAVPPENVLASDGTRKGNKYKEWAAGQKGIIASEAEREMYETMLDNMAENKAVREILDKTVDSQLVALFELGGLRLKARPDGVAKDFWWDLKTTKSRLTDLHKVVVNFSYADQDFIYQHAAAAACGMCDFAMPFVFVQKVPPYACRAVTIPRDYVAMVGEQLISTIEDIQLRHQTGEYLPAETERVVELTLPSWAYNQTEGVIDLDYDDE